MSIIATLKKLHSDRHGNFAVISAIAMIPVIAAAGIAVDFSSMSRADAAMQNASDGAVLFAARYYEVNDRLPAKNSVEEFVQANYTGKIGSIDFYVKNDQIFVEAKSSFKPVIMQLFSKEDLQIRATSAAPLPKDVDMEIVLSLDTTFSMTADNKIGGLKIAASNFVNTMFDKANSRSRVKMALVPFAQYVNVGLNNRNAIWLTVPPDETISNGNVCTKKQDILAKKNCRWEKKARDGIEYDAQVCDYDYGEPYEVCGESKTTIKWNGCVGSRKFPTNLKDSVEDYDKEDEKFPGLMNEWCQSSIMPLSKMRNDMLSQINSLYATGETYVADGVMWGVRVLSPQEPFSEGLSPAKATDELRKIMVLMTDGENQRAPELPTRPNHWSTDKSRAKDWTKLACVEAKKQGIEIFSITFGNSVPAESRTIMEKCATSSDHYFNASDSGKLDETFAKIAGILTRVRLTQ